jgi:hypothetical protein
MYLSEATFTGKSLYYSYETCGSKDTFTTIHNKEACVNQDTKEDCMELTLKSGTSKCAWTDGKCVGAELVNHPLCKKVVGKNDKEEEKSGSAAFARLAFQAAVVAAAAAAATFTA